MILALLLQAAAPSPAPLTDRATLPHAASPRTLTGRFTCEAGVYEVQVTATPALQSGQAPTDLHAKLDRLALNGRAVDAGSLAEAARTVARLGDVQSLDVRCRPGGGELSFYGSVPQADGTTRNGRVRGTLAGARVTGVGFAVQQR